ncbi:MAG: DUF1659 domain-containing protein [Clostridiales bacterium]|nr:DUF1659 domain-containing protein [Clostridiales bacterium]
MALEVRPIDTRLQIQFDLGQDQNGRRVTRTKTLTRIKNDIDDNQLYDLANQLAGLQIHPVSMVRKIAQFEYVNV